MIVIANLQYGWTLFVEPMREAHGWTRGGIQLAFSLFIALETWFTPFAGWAVDGLGPRRGPPVVVACGGLAVGLGWVINGQADSLALLYLGSAISGLGGGAVYATCVGNAVKWFPDRRGLAVGCTAAGFGAGAALTVIPVRAMIAASGYASTFVWFGVGQGVVLVALAWLLRGPSAGQILPAAASRLRQSDISFTPRQMLTSPGFWLLYVMFTLISASGLMATAQLATIARGYGVADTVLLFGAPTLIVALVIDNVMNGVARPFFGWVSDRIGRETTMAVAFGLGAVSYWMLGTFGAHPVLFVLGAALIFFTWGEIFSLFPSTCADMFGPKYATINTSLLYTAKGLSAWLVPLANVLIAEGGDWRGVFAVTAMANGFVALLAMIALPMVRAARDRRPVLAE